MGQKVRHQGTQDHEEDEEEVMAKFRKKPVVIDALKWTGNEKEMREFLPASGVAFTEDYISIHTLEGTHKASLGDWVIRGVAGEFYPVKPDIFIQTYELVEE